MTYQVAATRWAHGWELHIGGVGVTQVESLDDAELTVRDYLELDGYDDARTAVVTVDRTSSSPHRGA